MASSVSEVSELAGYMNAEPRPVELGVLLAADAPPFTVANGRVGVSLTCMRAVLEGARTRVRAGVFGDAGGASAAEQEEVATALVAVNAGHHTAWNGRRMLALGVGAAGLRRELDFVDVVMSRHPKIAEAWAYRRWLLERHSAVTDDALAERELAVCSNVARA